MADVSSSFYAAQLTARTSRNGGNSFRGFCDPVRFITFRETVTAGATDVIQIAVLPRGMIVIPELSRLGAPVAGTFTLRKKSTAGTTTTIGTAAPGATTKGTFAAAAWNTDISAAETQDGDVLELVVGANAISAAVVVLEVAVVNAAGI